MKPLWIFRFALMWALSTTVVTVQAQLLEADLQRLSVSELASNARQLGDASRGAIVFHQPSMACAKCHAVGGNSNVLGPDLLALEPATTDESLVDSVLYPSKVIRKGFESVIALTVDGQVLSGLLVEQTEQQVVLRDVTHNGALVTLPADKIEEIKQNELSIMPAGQMNQLNSRQQFYDLIRYLIEIRDGGVERARELQPSSALLTFTIPAYENHVDHAGLIGTWNDKSFQRGEAIYQRVCANCHGTHDQVGSLPTSLRFADGKFKNGSDALSMYRTLTHGFGQMTSQSWMVPSQKYDVIHYIREAYLQPHNPTQFVETSADYLASLPKGDTFGPEPNNIEAWSAMDYGPSLTHTYEIPGVKHNFAYKGIAVRLDPGAGGVSRGRSWMIFDTDTLRVAAGWSARSTNIQPAGAPSAKLNTKVPSNAAEDTAALETPESPPVNNFIDWRAIQFNGEHGIHPSIVGDVAFANSTGPGWANPAAPLDQAFRDDQRVLGRDGRQYGPLPRAWGQFKGLYHHDQRVIFSYTVGNANILEMPRMHHSQGDPTLLLRTFNVGARDKELILQVAEYPNVDAQLSNLFAADESMVVVQPTANVSNTSDAEKWIAGFAPRELSAEWILQAGQLRLRIPAGEAPLRFSVWLPEVASSRNATDADTGWTGWTSAPQVPDADLDLTAFTSGGSPRWPQTLTTRAELGPDSGPFALDILTAPESNPWLALTRFTGLDFYPDGRIAVCSWDGDVWIVTPREDGDNTWLDWRRIASGLFQPLGLKIVHGKIHLICRDQLTVLHDLNGDGEVDFYQCLNNDHQVTEHFHEFAMGLQTDAAGNFYYAKSGCHGKAAVVPHHGTLLKVTADGSQTEILANGFRAANGVCLNPDGSFVVTDQEGFWNPKNRINWVTLSKSGQPKFYGNMLGYHSVTDASDAAMVQPLCWITNDFDRSPAELLWVDSPRWGALTGSLLNLSYGYGKVYLVPHENVDGTLQGGMIELPLPAFPTGVMRGRFHQGDGQLYLCGMFAWAGSATHPGGLYRIRATDQPTGLPLELKAHSWGIEIKFTDAIDPASISNTQNYAIQAWDLKRTAKYGSEHFNQREWPVESAQLASDGKTLKIKIPDIAPTWGMEIVYRLKADDGRPMHGKIHNTIHRLQSTAE